MRRNPLRKLTQRVTRHKDTIGLRGHAEFGPGTRCSPGAATSTRRRGRSSCLGSGERARKGAGQQGVMLKCGSEGETVEAPLLGGGGPSTRGPRNGVAHHSWRRYPCSGTMGTTPTLKPRDPSEVRSGHLRVPGRASSTSGGCNT